MADTTLPNIYAMADNEELWRFIIAVWACILADHLSDRQELIGHVRAGLCAQAAGLAKIHTEGESFRIERVDLPRHLQENTISQEGQARNVALMQDRLEHWSWLIEEIVDRVLRARLEREITGG